MNFSPSLTSASSEVFAVASLGRGLPSGGLAVPFDVVLEPLKATQECCATGTSHLPLPVLAQESSTHGATQDFPLTGSFEAVESMDNFALAIAMVTSPTSLDRSSAVSRHQTSDSTARAAVAATPSIPAVPPSLPTDAASKPLVPVPAEHSPISAIAPALATITARDLALPGTLHPETATAEPALAASPETPARRSAENVLTGAHLAARASEVSGQSPVPATRPIANSNAAPTVAPIAPVALHNAQAVPLASKPQVPTGTPPTEPAIAAKQVSDSPEANASPQLVTTTQVIKLAAQTPPSDASSWSTDGQQSASGSPPKAEASTSSHPGKSPHSHGQSAPPPVATDGQPLAKARQAVGNANREAKVDISRRPAEAASYVGPRPAESPSFGSLPIANAPAASIASNLAPVQQPATSPLDLMGVIDRLSDARLAARGTQSALDLAHPDFGRVTLQFTTRGDDNIMIDLPGAPAELRQAVAQGLALRSDKADGAAAEQSDGGTSSAERHAQSTSREAPTQDHQRRGSQSAPEPGPLAFDRQSGLASARSGGGQPAKSVRRGIFA